MNADEIALDAANKIVAIEALHPTQHKAKVQCAVLAALRLAAGEVDNINAPIGESVHPLSVALLDLEGRVAPCWFSIVRIAAERIALATSAPSDNGVPAGWKLVPVEPTLAMAAAAEQEYCRQGLGIFSNFPALYKAMLSAVPEGKI